jgi:hypothetical protein
MVGKAIYEPDQKPFEHFIAMAYDDRLEEFNMDANPNGIGLYSNWVDSLYARSRTDFKIVFDMILEKQMSTPDLTELTVIFFTDGCDTCNGQ